MPTNDETLQALRMQNADLRDEVATLRAIVDDTRDHAISRMLSKIDRQRKALDACNRRDASRRFVLRTLDKLGRGLTRDEYVAERDAVANEQLRTRIHETPEKIPA